ncbi:MAG: hypothetical protein ACK4UN_10765 [Limisphaerales bacterium]
MFERPKREMRGLSENSHVIVDFLPEPFVPVMVHAESYTCLGYLDERGIWRGRFGDRPLTSRVVAWEPL